jgi:hypothetical protein
MSYNQDLIYDFIRDHPGCYTKDVRQHTGIIDITPPLRALVRDARIRSETIPYRGLKRYWVIP